MASCSTRTWGKNPNKAIDFGAMRNICGLRSPDQDRRPGNGRFALIQWEPCVLRVQLGGSREVPTFAQNYIKKVNCWGPFRNPVAPCTCAGEATSECQLLSANDTHFDTVGKENVICPAYGDSYGVEGCNQWKPTQECSTTL